tara:strand:+ start:195 stop:560 length:366 start_codon:yes stop_codon:yes gene_type:complete
MSDNTKKLAFECAKLQKKVNDFKNELEEKKKLLKNIMKNDGIKTIKGEDYSITKTTYKSEYSSSLAKEFNNIEKEITAKLLREDLISYIYKLNTAKYQKLKNMKIESEIDQFVKKKNQSQL